MPHREEAPPGGARAPNRCRRGGGGKQIHRVQLLAQRFDEEEEQDRRERVPLGQAHFEGDRLAEATIDLHAKACVRQEGLDEVAEGGRDADRLQHLHHRCVTDRVVGPLDVRKKRPRPPVRRLNTSSHRFPQDENVMLRREAVGESRLLRPQKARREAEVREAPRQHQLQDLV